VDTCAHLRSPSPGLASRRPGPTTEISGALIAQGTIVVASNINKVQHNTVVPSLAGYCACFLLAICFR
jgi:hypothetical protein